MFVMMKNFRLIWLTFLLCWTSFICAQDIELGRNYELRTVGGLVLDNQESLDPGSKLFVSKPVPGKESQVWQFQPVEGQKDTYLLVSPLSMHAIDNGGDGKAGDNIIQWSSDPTNPNQHWVVRRQSDGTYVFTSVASGFCLSYGERGIPGEPVVQQTRDAASYSRQWCLVPSNVQVKLDPLKTHSDEDWENPAVFAINKEEGHASFHSLCQCGRNAGRPGLSPPVGAYSFQSLSVAEWRLEVPLEQTAGRSSEEFLSSGL